MPLAARPQRPFSGYDDCGPYPFETATLSDGKGGSVDERGPIAHDLYIWNGKNTLALTKAVALTKCFELERMLINDEIGTIHHIHRGMGRSEGVNLPLSPLFAADYDLSRDEVFGSPPDDRPGDNHLLSQLCRNVECETIPCSSLILCMLPGLSTRETTAFPMLHKALSAHVKPNPPDAPSPLRPGNLPGKAPAGYPSRTSRLGLLRRGSVQPLTTAVSQSQPVLHTHDARAALREWSWHHRPAASWNPKDPVPIGPLLLRRRRLSLRAIARTQPSTRDVPTIHS